MASNRPAGAPTLADFVSQTQPAAPMPVATPSTDFLGNPAPLAGAIKALFAGSPAPAAAPVVISATGLQSAPTTQAAMAAARGGVYPPNAAIDPEFVRSFAAPHPAVDTTHPNAGGHAAAFAATANPGVVSAEEMARRTKGMTPYQMSQLRASYAPLVAPRDLIMGQQFRDENDEYAQRAADYKAGKPVLGGADGKTPLGPHDIFGEHQTALRAILQANPMYNMGAAGMVTSPTGN